MKRYCHTYLKLYSSFKKDRKKEMRIMAHRGFSSNAPENTLTAFKKAIDLGCQWIELDVQLTADNVPIVIHDETLERCTTGHGVVSSLTLKNIKQLSAGSWFDPEFYSETVPTLEEVLLLAITHSIKINVELKPYLNHSDNALCYHVAQVIKKLQIPPSLVLFSSFSLSALEQIKQVLPEFRRGMLWEKIPEHPFSLLENLDAYSVHCDYRYLNQTQAHVIKEKGYQLYCYTPNNPLDVQMHWLWGVDMMITDTPQRYLN